MDWPVDRMDRLYELYQQHFHELRLGVIAANRSLGSTHPEQTGLELVGRDEFEQMLIDPRDPDVAERWIKRIVRGHEQEFPELKVA